MLYEVITDRLPPAPKRPLVRRGVDPPRHAADHCDPRKCEFGGEMPGEFHPCIRGGPAADEGDRIRGRCRGPEPVEDERGVRDPGQRLGRITSYNVCYTKLLRSGR